MLRLAFGLVIALLSQDALSADDLSPPHQQSSPIPSARYEVVQSPLAAKWTFRLDRHSGRVWQLVKTTSGDMTWEKMEVLEIPKISNPVKPRFQIFTSGLAARHTYLLDTESGMTWQLAGGKVKNKDGSEDNVNVWQPFEVN